MGCLTERRKGATAVHIQAPG